MNTYITAIDYFIKDDLTVCVRYGQDEDGDNYVELPSSIQEQIQIELLNHENYPEQHIAENRIKGKLDLIFRMNDIQNKIMSSLGK